MTFRLAQAAILSAALLATPAQALDTIEGSKFKVGKWDGEAAQKDGRFDGCAIELGYGDGQSDLVLWLNAGSFQVIYHDPRLKGTSGSTTKAAMSFDGDKAGFAVAGRFLANDRVLFNFHPTDDLDAFARHHLLTLKFEHFQTSLELESFPKPIERLKKCFVDYAR